MQAIDHQLRRDGFERRNGSYHRNGLAVKCEPRWLVVRTRGTKGGDLWGRADASPGLWKQVQADAGRVRREFHVPLNAIGDHDAWDEETGEPIDTVATIIEWARVTAAGELPPGWQAPPRQEVEDLLPKNALTLQTGPFVCQGHLHCDGQRLAIEYPLVRAVPADLCSARRAWLDVVLADAQNRCRLVRVARRATEESISNILIEVDLSGVPRFAMPELVRFATDAARHVVSRYVWASELLVDPTVKSTAWEIPPEQVAPAEGGQL